MMNKELLFALFIFFSSLLNAKQTTQQMEDSLNRWANFPSIVKPIKINGIQVKDKYIAIYTNKTLSGLSLDKEQIEALKEKFKDWLDIKNSYKVSIYSDKYELSELITDRFIRRRDDIFIKRDDSKDLSNRKIALWASHGIYYNIEEDRWKWQRATVWTVVEDIFSCEFAYLVRQMLENAGAEVFQPRGSWDDLEANQIGKSGFPRWAEAARYWLEYKNFPDSIWNNNHLQSSMDTLIDHYKDDIRCRARWVNYLCGGSKKNPSEGGLQKEVDLCLAIHTDGYSIPFDTATIGTLVIYSDTDSKKNKKLGDGSTRLVCRDLADYIQNQIVTDIRKVYCHYWSKRQLLNSNYFEACFPVIPSVIIEILSHNQMADMKYGLNPAFRFFVCRSVYKGVLRFLQRDAGIVQPLPICDFGIQLRTNNKPQMILTWQATNDSLEVSAKSEKYIVQVRHSEKAEWRDSLVIKNPRVTLNVKPGVRYDFRIIATNAGGRSFPSEILSAYISTNRNDKTSVMVVNGFNRVSGPRWFADSLHAGIVPGSYAIPDGKSYCYIGDQFNFCRSDEWKSDDECGFGMCYRDKATQFILGNTHDYPILHGSQLVKRNISYSSCNITALPFMDICNYSLLDIILGKEELDEKKERDYFLLIDDFIKADSAKKTIVSGSFLGDLTGASKSGKIKNEGGTYSFFTRPNTKSIHAEDVSSWHKIDDYEVLFRYTDSQLPACLYANKIILWGVPLESFTSFDKIYNFTIDYLLKKR